MKLTPTFTIRLFILSLVALASIYLQAQPGYIDTAYYRGMGLDNKVMGGLVQPDSTVVVVGNFARANERPIYGIVKLKQDGTIDYSFNGTGANGQIDMVLRQSDGKLIIGGGFTQYNGTSVNYIARLNTDGTLDTSYHATANASVLGGYLLSNGKAILYGVFTSFNSTTCCRIVRVNTNGTLDTNFYVSAANTFSTSINCMAVQADGKYIVAGQFTKMDGISENTIARLDTAGHVDTTFSSSGPGGSVPVVNGLSILPTGKIIAVGSFSTWGGTTANGIMRINSNGTNDGSFSSGTGFASTVYSLVTQPDSKMIAVGVYNVYNGFTVNKIVRIDTNAVRDTTFSVGGGLNGTAYSSFLNYDNKIYVGGVFTTCNSFNRLCFTRLQTNGSVDQTFFHESKINGTVLASAAQSSGKLIVGGILTYFNDSAAHNLVRLNLDGTLDTSFHCGTGPNNTVRVIAVLSNDKILIGGDFTAYNGTSKAYIVQLNSDGSIDNSFTAGPGAPVYGIEPLPGGQIIIGGGWTSVSGVSKPGLARLNSDGSLDNAYHPSTAGYTGQIRKLVLQPDGKILGSESFFSYTGVGTTVIVRFDTLGRIDTSFYLGSACSIGNAIMFDLEPSGKVIVFGGFTSYNGVSKTGGVLLKSNGQVDSSFTTNTGGAAVLANNGGAILGGTFTSIDGTTKYGLVSLDSTGAIDNTYFPIPGSANGYLLTTASTGYLGLDPISHRVIVGSNNNDIEGNISMNFAGLIGRFADVAIDSPSIRTPLCAGAISQVKFKNEHNFNKANILTVQLSDSSGSFSSPVSIGTQTTGSNNTGAGWDSITVTILGGAITGDHYQVRITSSNPVYTSAPTAYFHIGPVADTITAGGPTTFCSGGSVVLSSQIKDSYHWSNSTTAQTATITSGGTYVVSVTVNNCAAVSNSISVTVNSLPTATAASNSPVCAGQTLMLTGGASSLTGYSWSGPSSYTSSSQSPTVSSSASTPMSGTYAITVSDPNSCTASASTSVTVNSLPSATAYSNSPVCLGQPLTLTGGANSLTTYVWSGPSSFTNSTQSPTVSGSATTGMSGSYSITVTNGNGCTATANTSVTINTLPSATATNNSPICANQALTLTGGTNSLTIYAWSGPLSYSSSGQSPEVSSSSSLSMTGTYIITVTDGNGCTSSASTNAVVNALPNNLTPILQTQTICAASSVAISLPGSQTGKMYYLKVDTTVLNNGLGNGDTLVLGSGNLDTTSTINILVIDTLTGCSLQLSTVISITVVQTPPIPLFPVPSTKINADSTTFTFNGVSSGTSGAGIEWSLDSTFSSFNTISSLGIISFTLTDSSSLEFWSKCLDSTTGCVSIILPTFASNTLQRTVIDSLDTLHDYYSERAKWEQYLQNHEDTTEDGATANYYRWRAFWDSRVDRSNGSFAGGPNVLKSLYTSQASLCSTDNNFISNWKCIGPSISDQNNPEFNSDPSQPERQGRTYSIWVEPGNEDHLIVGNCGGIWELQPNSTQWTCLSESAGSYLPTCAVGSVSVNPTTWHNPSSSMDIRAGLYSDWYGRSFYGGGHYYDLGIGICTNGVWSLDNSFLADVASAYAAVNDNSAKIAFPFVNDLKFNPNTGDLFISTQRFIFKQGGGTGSYVQVYDSQNDNSVDGVGIFAFAPYQVGDPNKVLCSASTSPYSKLLYSPSLGNANTWIDISNLLYRNTLPDTYDWPSGLNNPWFAVNGVNCIVTNAGAFHQESIQPSGNANAGLMCQLVNGINGYAGGQYIISFDAAIPPNASLQVVLCTGASINGTILNVPGSSNSTNQLVPMHSCSLAFTANADFGYVALVATGPGGAYLDVHNVQLQEVTPPISTSSDIVHESTDDIAYVFVRQNSSNSSIQDYLVKIDLDLINSIYNPIIWSKSVTSNAGAGTHGTNDLGVHPTIKVSPKQPNVIYLGGNAGNVSRVTDANQNNSTLDFLSVSDANTHVDIRSMNLFYTSNLNYCEDGSCDILYIGDDGGIAKTSNGGGAWSSLNYNNYATNLVPRLSSAQTATGEIMMGCYDNGTWVSSNYKWKRADIGDGDGAGAAINDLDASKGWQQSGSYGPIINYGYNSNITTGTGVGNIPIPSIPGFSKNLMPMYYHPWSTNFIMATDDIYTYGGPFGCPACTTWLSMNDPTISTNHFNTEFSTTFGGKTIQDMWVGPLFDLDYQYVVTTDWNIYQHDLTGAWNLIGDINSVFNNPDPTCYCQSYTPLSVTADPANPTHVWVSFGGVASGTLSGSPDGRVMYYDGSTWTDVSNGLPWLPVNKLVYQEGSTDIIYAATDAGVYVWDKNIVNTPIPFQYNGVDMPTGSWVCFNTNLPPCLVTDLDLSPCDGKLRASTWGRSVWETDISATPPVGPPSTYLWNSSRNITSTVDIPSGYTLTVSGSSTVINMAKGTNIIIEPGAKLYVDGATFTNLCGSFWDGIVVKGNTSAIQDLSSNNYALATSSNQGFVYLNNATIENAHEAIRVWGYTPGCNPCWAAGQTGGIVVAEGTTFHNNRRDAEFTWYRYFSGPFEEPNQSLFYQCNFNKDGAYQIPNDPFDAFVTMWGTYGVSFQQCNFTVTNDGISAAQITNSMQLGDGIRSIDAAYSVTSCNFTGLTDGILVENSDPNQNVKIVGCAFTDNYYGADLSNSNYSIVGCNYFTTGHLNNVTPSSCCNYPFGLAFDFSTQFNMQKNIFDNSNGIDADLAGWEIFGSGFTNTSIDGLYSNLCVNNKYNFSSSNSTYVIGNVANYQNTGWGSSLSGFLEGLVFLCNQNTNYSTGLGQDFYVGQATPIQPWDGIGLLQMGVSSQGALTAVGNNFSSATANNQFQNFENRFLYGYNGSNPAPTAYYSLTSIIPTQITVNPVCYTWDYACAVGLIPPSGYGTDLEGISSIDGSYQSNVATLYSRIDGGHTNDLKILLVNAATTNADSIVTVLDSLSPYLSSEVLLVAATRTDIIADTPMFNLMYSNPDALVDNRLFAALQKLWGSPQIDTLVQRMSDTTSRTNLQFSIFTGGAMMDSLSRDLLTSLKSDSSRFDHTYYRSVLSTLNDRAADYMRVHDYLSQDYGDSAIALLDSMPEIYSIDTLTDSSFLSFRAFIRFKKELQDDSLTIANLDSVRVLELNDIAINGYGSSARQAKAILHFFYGYPYHTQLEVEPQDNHLEMTHLPMKLDSLSTAVEQVVYIKVYPNPTNGNENFEYKLPCDNGDANLIIADMSGHAMYSYMLGSSSSLQSVDTRGWSSGIYLYRLTCNGKAVGSGKFEVVK